MYRHEVESLLRVWQERLRLGNWLLEVKWQIIEGTEAMVETESMYDYATVTLHESLLDRDIPFVEKTLIHELVHLLDRDRKAMFAEIEGSLAPDTFRLFSRIDYMQTEGLVDKLASILYELAREDTSRTS